MELREISLEIKDRKEKLVCVPHRLSRGQMVPDEK
jgi:hypothetical protein